MKNIRSSHIHIKHPSYLVGQSLLHPVFNQFHSGLSASWFTSENACSVEGVFDNASSVVRCLVILSGSCEIHIDDDIYILASQDIVMANLQDSKFKINTSHDFSCLELHITLEFLEDIKTPSWETEIFTKRKILRKSKLCLPLRKAATSLCLSMQKGFHNAPLRCAMALAVIGHSFEHIQESHPQNTLSTIEKARLDKAYKLLLSRKDIAPRIIDLAKYSGLSATRLKTGFREIYGCGPYSLFQAHRMEHAKILLKKYSVTETAIQLGYSNISHFSAAFQRQFGKLPNTYRKKN
ncbi:AraC-type helix-turn-helix transcriptional regulator (plasmid) [Zymomonas mobilis subsp. mobilis ZM4 = ATCC 31821]|uniref:Transcriptional regulator, AraC family n=4 Tax=Zymomonas mobilis TaxID=542 RepID=A0A806D7V3_ZYMMO|nr:AraC family transcriptional regulator [Zymomonas mobilis]AAF23807.1 regulator protein PchR [Zymomonas mobilis subsp. mobilis ZM4 = ATCC 31821]ADC33904.1 transcriptional regulator, AraC family [Zymomonas mobilis subsp. mobilis ZM4 = ATCC 31821]AHB11111.1 DNA-binding domain-containing protein, AraC-type [Zymomonas mobilis subsp. mobilis str. CP4 = NRRL B-14023]AHJ71475.1 Adenosine deaminase [Zymomonas mobilis subsp. mobilis NRRL B-12526]AVZ26915.1 AraC-type helix-turn-helix transcriptional re